MTGRLLSAAVAALLLGAPPCALAQDRPSPEAVAEARAHFERGTDFYNEGRLDAALAEFQRAYEVAPAYPVLYNVGRVHAELGHPVEASRAFAQYLAEGGTTLAAARRTEVEGLLATQRARIARLQIESNVDGSIVSVDGADVATTPLAAPIEVGAGHHIVGVRAPGYEAVTIAVDLAGSAEQLLSVDLRSAVAARGFLRVTAALTGVVVTVDGTEVGRTPLDTTIPVSAGEHDVLGTRPGYIPDRHHIVVEDGAEVEVRLRLDLDPDPPPDAVGVLALALPEARTAIRVDGEDRNLGGDLTLPIGDHVLEITVEDRQPWAGTIAIAVRLRVVLAPELSWTDESRRDRLAAAQSLRDAGIGLGVAGGAVLVAGIALLGWNETEIAATDARGVILTDEFRRMCDPIMLGCDAITNELRVLSARQSEQNVIRGVSIAVTALGGVLAGLGLTLALTAPSSDEVDAAAHAELRLGPGGIEVTGEF